MPNRHGQDDDYRYGFNGEESDDEVFGTKGTSYDLGARTYDARIGRMRSTDPWEKKYAWQSSYAYFKNSPISQIDWKGFGHKDDKFYNEKGDLLYDDGIGNDSYIVAEADFDKSVCEVGSKSCGELTKKLKAKGKKAYSTEEEAAKAWAPGGFNATKKDGLERAVGIFQGTMSDGAQLFVLGNTVSGQKSKQTGVQQEVDPSESKAIVGEVNLLDVKYYTFEWEVRRKYANNPDFFGRESGNPITFEGNVAKPNNYWKVSGVNHTHQPNGRSTFSASYNGNYEGNIGGDIGFAIRGVNVYLVPTSYPEIRRMYLLKASDMKGMGFSNTGKAETYGSMKRETIPLK